jgi:RsiW-degrading membrane proteinase PrsW (M82 family)
MKCPPPIMMDSAGTDRTMPGRNLIDSLKDLITAIKTRPPQQPLVSPPRPASSTPTETIPPDHRHAITVEEEPTLLLESFKVGDVKSTVMPFDQYTLEKVIGDKVFWGATGLCAMPMFFMSLNDEKLLRELILPLFWMLCAVGFLLVVGRMFQRLILRRTESIRLPIAAFFVTLFIGVPLMLFLCGKFLPSPSENVGWKYTVIGSIMEEMVKILPVIICLLYFSGKTSLKLAFALGFLSSVGLVAGKLLFAVPWCQGFLLDNMTAWLPVFQREIEFFRGSGDDIFFQVFPIFSLLIVHAVWTAILTYYLFCAVKAGIKGVSFFLIGLAIVVLLHILYITLCNQSAGAATFIAAGSFVLFYIYLTQVRRQIVSSA